MLHEIYARYKRPFYLYRERVIRSKIEELRDALPQFEFLYSVKTNPMEPVVSFIAGQGLGADAASVEEVEKAVRAGLPREKIFYSAPGRAEEELAAVWDKAVITADSFHELELLQKLAEQRGTRVRAGVRVNPDFSMGGGAGAPSKFGIDEEQLWAAGKFFTKLDRVEVCGIHVHLRSQVLSWEILAEYYRTVLDLARKCSARMGWKLEFINFGGGLGLVYDRGREEPLALEKLSRACSHALGERKMQPIRLIIETGRFLTCEAGTYYTPVTDIKLSRGVKYLLVKNTLNGFLRPSLAELVKGSGGAPPACEPLFTGENAFGFRLAGREDERSLERVTVCGDLCTGADVMAQNILLPRAEIGDLLAVSHAGSYACTLSPMHFSGHRPPIEVYEREDGGLAVETWEGGCSTER